MEKVYRRCFPSLIIAINSGSDGRSSRGRGHGESEFQPRPRCHTHRFYSLFLCPSFFHLPPLAIADAKKSTRVRPRLSFGLLAIFHPCHSMQLIAVYHLAGEKFVLTKRDGVYLTWMRRQTRRTRIRGPAIFFDGKIRREHAQLCKYYIAFSSIER